MVDRIVPATTDADLAEAERLLGVHDAAPVVAEPFGQWIIEDRFAAARPRWEEAGAQFVADVAPFETMKLRLLNGSHSTLAYLGFLLGHEFVWQASARSAASPRWSSGRWPRRSCRRSRARRASTSAAYCAALIAALSQSGAAAPHAADRDGRLAEAAAAPARHGARPPRRRRVDRAPRAGGRRLDPLRERHATSRARRSTCRTRWPRRSRASCATPAAIPARDRRRLSRPRGVFGADLVAHYAFREAVRAPRDRAVPRRRAGARVARTCARLIA